MDDKYYGKEVVDPAEKLEPAYGEDWTAHADKIDEKLIENFMNTDRGTFWYTDQDRTNESTYCYWPQAHAMDVLIDAYLRIPEGDARRDTYAGYMSNGTRTRATTTATAIGELTVSAMPTPTTRSGSS